METVWYKAIFFHACVKRSLFGPPFLVRDSAGRTKKDKRPGGRGGGGWVLRDHPSQSLQEKVAPLFAVCRVSKETLDEFQTFKRKNAPSLHQFLTCPHPPRPLPLRGPGGRFSRKKKRKRLRGCRPDVCETAHICRRNKTRPHAIFRGSFKYTSDANWGGWGKRRIRRN